MQPTTHQGGKLRADFEEGRNEIRQLADEIRVQLHLAGMEVKDTWKELEPNLVEFEKRAEAAGHEVEHDLHDVGQDLRRRLRALRARMR